MAVGQKFLSPRGSQNFAPRTLELSPRLAQDNNQLSTRLSFCNWCCGAWSWFGKLALAVVSSAVADLRMAFATLTTAPYLTTLEEQRGAL